MAEKIGIMSTEGGPTRGPYYTLRVDFLDQNFSIILKKSHQDMYKREIKLHFCSLEVGH